MANRVFSLFSTSSASMSKPGSPVEEEKVHQRAILPNRVARQYKNPHDDDINCIAISSDGSLLATGGNDKKLVLYSTATGTAKAVLTGALQGVMAVDFNKTAEFILGSSNDNSTKIWDVNSKRLKVFNC